MPAQIIAPPHPRLAPWIHHVLVTIFEDGCVSQIPAVLSPSISVFARGAGWLPDHTGHYRHRMPRAALMGPRLKSTTTNTEAGTYSISILFRPGTMADILGPGVNEISEQTIPLDSIFPPSSVQFMLERIDENPDPSVWAQHVQQLLLENLREQTNAYGLQCDLQNIVRLFQPAEKFAAELGIGVRQLERHTARSYGATLRDLRRMARFGFSLTKMLYNARQRGDLTQIAHDFGYYDQSHMDRDFVALAGYSPTQLLRSLTDKDPRFWMYHFDQRDFQRLFVPEDVVSVQEIVFAHK